MIVVGVLTWWACGGNAMFEIRRDRRKPHFFDGLGPTMAPEPEGTAFPREKAIPPPPEGKRNPRLESLIRAGKLEEAVELCLSPYNMDPSQPLETRKKVASHYLNVIDGINRGWS
jgi:hypothetical protein